MTFPWPNKPTAFPIVNTLQVNGIPLTGKWTLTSAKKVFGWQIVRPYAWAGGRVLPSGDELVVATFKGEFWDETDMQAFEALRPLLFSKPTFTVTPGVGPGAITAALAIKHPELQVLGMDAAVVKSASAMMNDGYGLWSLTIELLEYHPPLPAPPAPSQKIPAAPAPPAPSAITNEQIEAAKAQKANADAKAQLAQALKGL